VSLAYFTKHLEGLEGEEGSMIMKTNKQEQQIKQGSHSLKSLSTNDQLS
jgi:hypothetical protein